MKHIPNTVTLANLLCGCLSIVATFSGNFILAGVLILLAAAFDFLDGFLAGQLNAHSELGKQLDSLADIVSFGVAPAMIAFRIMAVNPDALPFPQLPYIAFVMVLFSALRLAKFNAETTSSDYFIGMPTPANGMFWATLPLVLRDLYERDLLQLEAFLFHPINIAVLCVVFAAFLVLPIRMFSLKLKQPGFVPIWQQVALVGTIAILFFIIGFAAIPVGILIYPLLSLTLRK